MQMRRKWVLRTLLTLGVVGLLILLRYGLILQNLRPERIISREVYVECELQPGFPVPQSALTSRGENPNLIRYRWAAMKPGGVMLPNEYLDTIASWGWEAIDMQDEFIMLTYSFTKDDRFVHIVMPNTMHQEMGAFYVEIQPDSERKSDP